MDHSNYADWLPGAFILASQVFIFLSNVVAARDAKKSAAGLLANPIAQPTSVPGHD